jgi:4-amino-4-deoxy-L-arabinose transferase-like glycosyltransferase
VLVAAALAGCFAAQCLWFVGTQSLTYDEPVHLLAGLDAWRHGRFEQWNDQPPLARLLLTAPLLLSPPDTWRLHDLGPSGANFWTVSVEPDPISLAWRTRSVNVALGLLLAAAVWIAARRLFSEDAANLALAVFAGSPALIAHFSLATVDGCATLMCFAAAGAVVAWRERPSFQWTVTVGLTLGGFLVSKFSAPPLVLLALVVMIASGASSGRGLRAAKVLAASVLAALVVWGTYGWHVGPVTFRSGSLAGPYARGRAVIVPTSNPLDRTLSLPAPEFLAALGGVLQHGVRGQPASLLGEVRTAGGWRSYFPIAVLLKWPLTVWLLVGATGVLLVAGRVDLPSELGTLMLFPMLLFVLAIASNLNIGDRYVLPAYPFLLLLCAAAWHAARARPALRRLILALVALQAADALRYAPDYLSYMNAFVAPDDSYRVLSDSNLDWGQGLLALRVYQDSHPDSTIWLAYFGGVDPHSYGIRFRVLGEQQLARGTVVVSATHLSGQYLRNPQAYHWLFSHRRTAILNHTLHVFEVP